MDDLIGLTINNYQIEEKLGQGGMGIVYRARHPILEIDVALKVMRPDLADQEGFYGRFEREAQTIARLQHPGIVGVTNFGQHDGVTYLMMDYVEGPSLRALLQDSPFGLPLEAALRLTIEMAQALNYAHGKVVLHLDLKPDNILLDASEVRRGEAHDDCPYRPVITDFGLAKLLVAPGVAIEATMLVGTPHYMSPEQCTGEALDERSDIYSLGVMLYEILTGQRPFPVTSIVDAVRYHTTQIPDPPSAHMSSLPAALEDLVLRMLAKPPDQRPSSGEEVADTLAGLLGSPTPVLKERVPAVAPAADAAVVTPTGQVAWSADRAPVYIQVVYEGRQLDRFPMNAESIIAGRLPTCDLRLEAGDRLVSKRHCEICRRNGEMMVRDLHSTNKTYLNDAELTPDVLTPWPARAAVRVGLFTLTWALSQTGELGRAPEPPQAEPGPRGDSPTIKCENGRPRTLRLSQEPVIVGRLPTCDMVVANAAVSKQHCQLRWDGRQVEVSDLGSTNGTFLGEERLESGRWCPWQPDTPLRIGPYAIQLD